MGMKSSHVMGIVKPVTLYIGDEEPQETQILRVSSVNSEKCWKGQNLDRLYVHQTCLNGYSMKVI